MGSNLFIGEAPEALHRSPQGWIWLKPTADGVEIYELDEGGWVLRKTVSLANHQHTTHGDINFTGSISSDSEAGIDSSGEGEFELGQIESIKIRNGLIVALTEK